MADLIVELYGVRVGALTGPWRTFDFLTEIARVSHALQDRRNSR
jgi:serine/threonine-protein kinase HipA